MLRWKIHHCQFFYFPSSKACFRSSPSQFCDVNEVLERVYVLCHLNHLQEALSLFKTLDGPLSSRAQTCKTYAALFRSCALHGSIIEGQTLHRLMVTRDLISSWDLYIVNHLINMYAKCGWVQEARRLLDEMPQRNVVSWTALISGYSQHGHHDDCFLAFREMLAYCRPSEFAFCSVISSCARHDSGRGRQVHALALKLSFEVYMFVGNALISMYCKNCFDVGVRDAWAVFKSMEFKNMISWNSLIAGLQLRKLGFQAVCLFSEMHSVGMGFDHATLLAVLPSLSACCEISYDMGLNICLQLHCLTFKTGLNLETEVSTALVKAYSDLGEVSCCSQVFMSTHEYSDLVAWTAIMTASVEKIPEKTLYLFSMLRRKGFILDAYSFSIALKASAAVASERNAWMIHTQIIKDGLGEDTLLKNALIFAYARCGSVYLSRKIFDETLLPDTISWNSMLKAYSLHGQGEEAMKLFLQMNVKPDGATFISLLSACNHSGMVEEGLGIFNAMWKSYGVAPQLDHYACLVDILGRSGRVFEAEELVRKMPLRPDGVVWNALLAACGKHSETQLAMLASMKLNNIDPGNSFGYVQLCNLYFSSGAFNRAQLVRDNMEESRVKKKPGLSWY